MRSLPAQVAKGLWQKHVNRAWSAIASGSSESGDLLSGDSAIEYQQPLDGEKFDVAVVGAGIMGVPADARASVHILSSYFVFHQGLVSFLQLEPWQA